MVSQTAEVEPGSPIRQQSLEVEQNYAGRLRNFYGEWQKITTNSYILQCIKGYCIPFECNPIQSKPPKSRKFNNNELIEIKKNIKSLLLINAIQKCKPKRNQFISPYFLVPKPNNKNRFILNLKALNKFISPPHFKLEDYRSVKNIVTPNLFMASVDLQDAYFTISVNKEHRKYLRFIFEDDLYEFTCVPFGLSTAPFLFTKILKPLMQFLRTKGLMSINYLDDFLLLGYTKEECLNNIHVTISIIETLGFIVNYNKSCLYPKTKCKYLGFIFDSQTMTIELPLEKKNKGLVAINSFLKLKTCKIRTFARIIGQLISFCPAVKYGWLHTKLLEREKYIALKHNEGNFEGQIRINNIIADELKWWVRKIPISYEVIKIQEYTYEIFTDSSSTGWGVYCNGERAHGFWSVKEIKHHINYLELLAVFNGLKCFARNVFKCSILLRIDNTTAISYINRMGGIRHKKLSKLSRKIWQWCEARDLWIFASYIASKQNVEADNESRAKYIETEYSLNDRVFKEIVDTFGTPEIDLFASNINAKVQKYVSWKRDPASIAVDAFTISWKNTYFYAFPPFSLVARVLNKIITERAEGIVIVPFWKTQPWFPIFTRLQISDPIFFCPDPELITSPFRSSHPLWKNITLVTARLSGNLFHDAEFQKKPVT